MANFLTLLRLLAIPFIVFLSLREEYLSVFVIFVIASLTDLADGYVARRTGKVTKIGIFLDPLADRLLLITTIAMAWVQGLAAEILCALLIARDILAMTGYQWIKGRSGQAMKVSPLGKISSAFAMIAVAALFILPETGSQLLLAIAVVFAYATLLDYCRNGLVLIKEKEGGRLS